MAVIVDDASLRRAWRRVEGDFLWEFVPERVGVDLGPVAAAILAANDVNPDGTGAWCAPPLLTERGTAVAELYADPDWAEDQRWFGLVAAELAGRGFSGRIAAARAARLPRWVEDRSQRLMTAMVGLPVDPAYLASPEQGRAQFGVREDLAVQVAELAAARAGGGIDQHFVIRDLYIARLTPDELGQPVVRAAVREGAATAIWASARARRFHSLGFSTQGTVTFQIRDEDAERIEQLESMTALLRAISHLAEVAWCRLSSPEADWRSSPQGLSGELAQFPQLRKRFVPDAHGVLLLTAEHLAKARDLSDWHSEELGNDRALLTHGDADAWFAHGAPDPDVLVKARADLGPMILTKEDVREHRISVGLPG